MAQDIFLPDTGSSNPVEIIELHVKSGDNITEGQTLLTLESDKATIDVPATAAGMIEALHVALGQKVRSGDKLLTLSGSGEKIPAETKTSTSAPMPAATTGTKSAKEIKPTPNLVVTPSTSTGDVLAGPAMRRMARALGVDLTKVTGTGRAGRILQEDIEAFVKRILTSGGNTAGSALPTMPDIDFAQFGPIEKVALNRIKRLTAQNLSRNWLLAPHVTQFDEADITELEAFRKKESKQLEQQGIKLTPLVFIMKAVVDTLKQFPALNASLDATGEHLVYKQYYHIGIAVDTEEGLVVPVIRDVDKKSYEALAKELAEISQKARDKKLTPQEMQGSSFTISSLGGIGGTAFTPIINLPNVAILGVSKSAIKPKYNGTTFEPRLMLPLSLSYDHRVIDGAEGARFCVALARALGAVNPR